MTRAIQMIMLAAMMTLIGCDKRQHVDCQTSDWPLKNNKGWIVESEHYQIYTTVSDAIFQTASVDLAEGLFSRIKNTLTIEPKDKMKVYVFKNTVQWIAMTQAKFGAQAESYLRIRNGGYSADDFAAFYYMGRYPTLTILAHELFHLYLSASAGGEQIPAWLNEGLATYFEAHEWDGMFPVFTPNKNLFRQNNLVEAISTKQLFPLKELLATHAGEVSKKPQQKVLAYYAQLWGMIQFLQQPKSPYHEGFKKMLADLGTTTMTMKAKGFLTTVKVDDKVSFGEAVFRSYISDDLEQFENELNEYLPALAGIK
jgi:hypothetical protein